jgi:anti-sigma factor RsiW
MSRHEHFEELCSLAVLGEVSPEEWTELEEHLGQCPECRAAYADFAALTAEHLPAADRSSVRAMREPVAEVTAVLRQATFAKVANEGFHISPEAMAGTVHRRAKATEWLGDVVWSMRARLSQLTIVATLLAVGVVGVMFVRHDAVRGHQAEQLRSSLLEAQNSAARLKQQLDHAADSQSEAKPDASLQQQLNAAQERIAQLDAEHQRDIRSLRVLEAQVLQFESEKTSAIQDAQNKEGELTKIRGQMEALRADASQKESELVAQQYRISELSDQLGAQKVALDREQQLLAEGRDIRDVIGARNLHIIDVHDQDAHGESRPFGRIFLTEGKRLIFYAYDLNSANLKNASFQAWGQRADGGRAALNLGIFYIDDQKQSRWALKIEDPNLLKAIDSVFVTVEPHGGTKKPSGKKLMYAYLRNPINHP